MIKVDFSGACCMNSETGEAAEIAAEASPIGQLIKRLHEAVPAYQQGAAELPAHALPAGVDQARLGDLLRATTALIQDSFAIGDRETIQAVRAANLVVRNRLAAHRDDDLPGGATEMEWRSRIADELAGEALLRPRLTPGVPRFAAQEQPLPNTLQTELVRALLCKDGMTTSELAEAMGKSVQQISNLLAACKAGDPMVSQTRDGRSMRNLVVRTHPVVARVASAMEAEQQAMEAQRSSQSRENDYAQLQDLLCKGADILRRQEDLTSRQEAATGRQEAATELLDQTTERQEEMVFRAISFGGYLPAVVKYPDLNNLQRSQPRLNARLDS